MDLKRFSQQIVLLGLISWGLSACSSQPCDRYLKNPPPVVPEKLIKLPKPINVKQRRQYDLCVLKSHGVQVIRLGETWTLIFSSDDLFDNNTAELSETEKPVLATAADFMKTYSKIAVAVKGYSDNTDDMKNKFGSIKKELTQRQADSVANFLASQQINARLIDGKGFGAQDPVAWNGSAGGRHFNRRIEIFFKYYRDNKAWY